MLPSSVGGWLAPRLHSRSRSRGVRCGCSSGAISLVTRIAATSCTRPTVEIVRRLGILDLLEARGAGRWHGLRFVDSGGKFDASSEVRESWLLNHAEMEAAFLDAAESHGAVIQYDVGAVARTATAAPAGGCSRPTTATTRARFVVGADGAESLTRRTLDIDHSTTSTSTTTGSWCSTARRRRGSRPDYGFTLPHPDGIVWILPTTPAPVGTG